MSEANLVRIDLTKVRAIGRIYCLDETSIRIKGKLKKMLKGAKQ